MKKLWDVIVEKAKEVEAHFLLLGLGLIGLFVLWASTAVVFRLFMMITTIVGLFAGTPVVGG